MTTPNMFQELVEFTETYEKAAKKMFARAFKDFFEAAPEVKFITFKLYAPYFNDGDACIPGFRSDFAFGLADFEEDEHTSYHDEYEEYADLLVFGYYSENKPGQLKEKVAALEVDVQEGTPELCRQVANSLQALGSDFFYNEFDEGQYVITRNGVEVLECEHD